MVGVSGKASRRLRVGIAGLAALIAFVSVATDPADARSRKKRYVKKPAAASQIQNSPRYAAIVLDAKTGKTLHQANPDALRHPASLTKIMTLYMLFEQLEAGKLKLHTPMQVSSEAASQPPTKLGMKPGSTLEVEDAIKSLVTKSANDAAVVIAEAIAGSEEAFARQMTQKARSLGMTKTIYRNASGLPDDEQVTTAREQALLGLAIQERFPKYYRYFSLTSFSYRGRAMRNHNKLLGRVEGVDGIKTGYTRASGFNLTTSVHRDGRHIIAVVLGGSTGAQRDARMRSLIAGNIQLASTVRTMPTRFAAPAGRGPTLAAAASVPVPPPAPAAKPVAHTLTLGSTAPIKPVPVRTVTVKLAPPATVAPKTAPAPSLAGKPAAVPSPVQTASLAPVATASAAVKPAAQPAAAAPRPGLLGVLPAAAAAAGKAIVPSASASEAKLKPASKPVLRSGWAIQVGAFEEEAEAKERLSKAQATATKILKKADPYTERTTKGEKTYYRARFAGFQRDEAQAACRQLKRNDIVCMALKI
jgi:D-alanyl-D-alanine carboxypeptidase